MKKWGLFFTALLSTVIFTVLMDLTNQPALPPYTFVILNSLLYIILLLWEKENG